MVEFDFEKKHSDFLIYFVLSINVKSLLRKLTLHVKRKKPIRYKRIIQFSLLFLAFSSIFLSLPFLCILTLPSASRKSYHEQFVYYVATEDCRKKAIALEEQVKLLMHEAKKLVRNPTKREDIKDVSRYSLIEAGYGYCDQQVSLFLAICRANNISGRPVYLYRENKVSHHAVCELFFDSSFHMIDPYNAFWFINKKGQIASMSEIGIGAIDTAASGEIPEHAVKDFDGEIKWRMGKSVEASFQNAWQGKLMQLHYAIFGASFSRLWFAIFDRRAGETLERIKRKA